MLTHLEEEYVLVLFLATNEWPCSSFLTKEGSLPSPSASCNANPACFKNVSSLLYKGKGENKGLQEVTLQVLRILKCTLHQLSIFKLDFISSHGALCVLASLKVRI